MSITFPILQKANFYPGQYGRETFLADAGQRSRAIIPGDDPGDQQPPERRGLYPGAVPRVAAFPNELDKLGAKVGDHAFARYLERYSLPRFPPRRS